MTAPDGRRYESSQERPYIRKIGRHWVLSGGRHLGQSGYPTWRAALAEVDRLARLRRSS